MSDVLFLSRFVSPCWFCLGLFHQAGCMRGVELSLSGLMSCFV